jgi:hypothetical protein
MKVAPKYTIASAFRIEHMFVSGPDRKAEIARLKAIEMTLSHVGWRSAETDCPPDDRP